MTSLHPLHPPHTPTLTPASNRATSAPSVPALPAEHHARSSDCVICRREAKEFGKTPYEIRKDQICSMGALPPDAMQIKGEFFVCKPIGAPFEGWMEPCWYDQLIPIEELVGFIERYDFPAWVIYEDSEGELSATATHLGIACDSYLPLVNRVDRFTFPQEGRRYSERFYAFIEACEETRQAGFPYFDCPWQDAVSRGWSVLAQNVLVDAIRTKIRARRAMQPDSIAES